MWYFLADIATAIGFIVRLPSDTSPSRLTPSSEERRQWDALKRLRRAYWTSSPSKHP